MKTHIKVLLIFAPMFIGSIIFEAIPREWLGDWKCQGTQIHEVKSHTSDGEVHYYDRVKGCDYSISEFHGESPEWHWGFRRWIVITAGVALTIVSINKVFEESN